MLIRSYRADDAAYLSRLYRQSVLGLGVRHYNPDQIRVWAGLAPSPERLANLMADGRTRLVAEDAGGHLVAFADLEPDGHIHFFYCAPEAAGKGVAARLYTALEETARRRGVTRLYAEASEAARRFFLKAGFSVNARRNFEVAGVGIHNYAVEKFLTK